MKITDEMVEAAVKAVSGNVDWVRGLFGQNYDNATEVMRDALAAAIAASPAGVVKPLELRERMISDMKDLIEFLAENPDNIYHLDADKVDALRRAIEPAGAGVETVLPDYCYDPSDWESTFAWDDRDLIHGGFLAVGEIKKVSTLLRGPDKWVAEVPTTWDEDGDPDKTEAQWFDTEEAARTALKGDEQ